MNEEIHLSSLIDIVAFADPASGKTSEVGCENAIVVVGQHPRGMALVLDEWSERTSSNELNAKIFEMHAKWKTRRFGCESSAQQNLWYEALVREALAKRMRIMLIPVEQPTNETKEWRITTTIQEWMHNGMLYVASHLTKLKERLRVYPGALGAIDDVDALASALRMLRNPLVRQTTADVEH